jgi:hypothetical protein
MQFMPAALFIAWHFFLLSRGQVGLFSAGGELRPPSAAAEPAALLLGRLRDQGPAVSRPSRPLGRGGRESLALTRVPLVAPLGLELGILGEEPQDLEWVGGMRMRISIRHLLGPRQIKRRYQLRC